jgi:mRNA interferase MazF
MNTQNFTVRRGQIYYADLSGAAGHEQAGDRPVLILSNPVHNRFASTVIAAPTSLSTRRDLPVNYVIRTGLCRGAAVQLDQLRTLDRSRLQDYVTQLSDPEMSEINKTLALSLGIPIYRRSETA